MFYKIIIQGKFYFLNRRSYDKLVKVITNKNIVYYKNEIIFKELEFLDDENFMISIPRHVGNYSDKVWKNTTNLFESCAQFAVSGRIMMWKVEEGQVLSFNEIEPTGDRSAVLSYNRGKKFLKEEGKEQDALEALSKSLDKCDRNAMAYERRAVVNLMLKNYVEAKEDFEKCLNIDNSISEAHLGLAKLLKYDGDIELALKHLNYALKTSVALQPLHWQSRRAKADIHIIKEEWDKAEFELKLLVNRKFKKDNPNFYWKNEDIFSYGIVKYNQYDFVGALELFEESMRIENGKEKIPKKDKYFFLGMAKKNAGKSGYIHDLKLSSELGNEDAEYMLEDLL
jgi:tetratricopeptide (TPR) repeat protein